MTTHRRASQAPAQGVHGVERFLETRGAADAARTAALCADAVLLLDARDRVADMALGPDQAVASVLMGAKGAAFRDLVSVDSRDKVDDLIASARAGETRWRQVNHPRDGDGVDLPVRYAGFAGDEGALLLVGQGMAHEALLQQRLFQAHQAMEAGIAERKRAETFYRALFQMTGEPVLVLDAATQKVTEANDAARRVFAAAAARLAGANLSKLIHDEDVARLREALADARTAGASGSHNGGRGPVEVRTREGAPMEFSVNFLRLGRDSHFVLRASLSAAASANGASGDLAALGVDWLGLWPDGVVVTTARGRVRAVNPAFLDLVQAPGENAVVGRDLSAFLGRSDVDAQVLLKHVAEHGVLRAFASVARPAFGGEEPAEVDAVRLEPSGDVVLLLRSGAPVASSAPAVDADAPRTPAQLAKLVGRVSLKQIVREATDVIEALCIETALDLTGDNRASAAEMLGVSRQSLYQKMRKNGIGDLD